MAGRLFYLKFLGFFIILIILFTINCNWPYSPEMQPIPNSGPTPPPNTLIGTIHDINTKKQTCNPSISQDQVNFPGCILWLGFSGNLNVEIPSGMTGYDKNNVQQHDRLTISDTSNTVRWFIMRNDLGVSGHLQDPEWTSHPNYICCLGEDNQNEEQWDGFVMRLDDHKSFLQFCEDSLDIQSTPHLWIPDSATNGGTVNTPTFDSSGFVSKNDIDEFFGTTEVKITFVRDKFSLYFLDYSESSPVPVPLRKPVNKETWNIQSPLISPEGNWVTYSIFPDNNTNHVYIQRLDSNSTPVLISEAGFEPHWWIDPVDPTNPYYIVYTRINGNIVVQVDLTDPIFAKDGSAGATVKQRLRGSTGNVPAHMGLQVNHSFPPELLVNLPFKGGLSRDGMYLCTGYIYTYLIKLP